MADQDTSRPGSSVGGRGYPSPIPSSPRPSVASRASRSSLQREQERQEVQAQQARSASVAHSRPETPQTAAAHLEEQQTQQAQAPPPPSPLQPAQPPFSPLFTLLTSASHSSNKQTLHHPTVHYIFADDDPEILTAALAHHHRGAYENAVLGDDVSSSDPANTSPDRAVLLDLEPTSDDSILQVAWASSLSPDWAVTSARVTRMEGNDGSGPAAAAGPSGNLVLKIEGVSIEPSSSSTAGLGKTPASSNEMQSSGDSAARQQGGAPAAGEYGDVIQDFEKRMGVLRKVVEAGAARQRALGREGVQISEATVVEKT